MDDQVEIKDLTEATPSDVDWTLFQLASDPFTVYKTPKSSLKGDKGDTGATGSTGPAGSDGANAYVYIAYASDDSGTGFTLTFDPDLNYIAILATDIEVPSPSSGDFTGLWKNYKGETGATGPQGVPGVSLLEETPSGTVDGSNTSFTTAHSPLYIVVDGTIRVAVSDISDINGNGFTVSGSGPYTIAVNSAAPPTAFIRSYYNA